MFELFDRKRWILLFDFLAKYAQRPISLTELYAIIVREGPRLNLNLSFDEFRSIMKEFEMRGIVRVLTIEGEVHVVLSDMAKYFVHMYSTTIIGL